jgi:predicted YcjX-like family ATPase
LELLLEQEQLPLFEAVKELAHTKQPDVPNVQIEVPDLCSYDELLSHLQRAPKEASS